MIMVAIVVMVVIIPVAIRVPALSFHIPPAMSMFPTIVACFRQLAASFRCLLALPAVMFDGLMHPMIRLDDSFLAVIRLRARRRAKQRQSSRQESRSNDHPPACQIFSMSHESFPPGNLHRAKKLTFAGRWERIPAKP